MDTITLVFIALALAMDAFAVSMAVGTTSFLIVPRARFRIWFHFGWFQGIMPVIGWFIGRQFAGYIEPIDHWLAFGLLAVIGSKMIHEAVKDLPEEYRFNPSKGWNLIMLSIATSIDALAVGLSLAMLRVEIWRPALMIGVITAILSLVGLYLGRLLGQRFGQIIEILGGLLLYAIGMKILISHLS